MMNEFLADMAPSLMELIGIALTGLLAWVARAMQRRWGIEIEARHREALHWALFTGIRTALARGLPEAQAVDLAIGYARESVPDALQALRPTEPVLTNLARAKLAEAVRPPS